jgi:hypothetical protein
MPITRNKAITKAGDGGLMRTAFRGANKWLVALGVYLVTLVPLIKRWATVKKALQAQLPPSLQDYWVVIAFLPFVIALLFQAFVAARRRWKEKKLAIRGVNYREQDEAGEDEYFSISPILRKDPEGFKRADKIHLKVLTWLRETTEQIVYLTSVSGAGKSSLLHAFVVPQLESGTPAFRVIVLRSFHDPAQALRAAVLTPGAI